jgi:S-adenosylmethionine/arginine decarboxylase-like enzyme
MENNKKNESGRGKLSGITIADIRSIQSLKSKRDTKTSRMHVLLDLYECEEEPLAKAKILEKKVLGVLKEFEMEPKIQTFYQFQPFGVTAIVYAQGLQFTMHTWPEYQSAAIDLYCFGSRKLSTDICNKLITAFSSAEYELKVKKR